MSNDNNPSKTGWIILIVSFLFMIYEIYTLISGEQTISEFFWEMNDRTTSVSFFVGLLMGHFFWPRKK